LVDHLRQVYSVEGSRRRYPIKKLEVRFNTKGSGGRVTLSKLSLFAEDGSEGFCFFLEDASDVRSNIGFLAAGAHSKPAVRRVRAGADPCIPPVHSEPRASSSHSSRTAHLEEIIGSPRRRRTRRNRSQRC
jgi:hypothetical protein